MRYVALIWTPPAVRFVDARLAPWLTVTLSLATLVIVAVLLITRRGLARVDALTAAAGAAAVLAIWMHLPALGQVVLASMLIIAVVSVMVYAFMHVARQRAWSTLWSPPADPRFGPDIRASEWLFPFLSRWGVPLLMGGCWSGWSC